MYSALKGTLLSRLRRKERSAGMFKVSSACALPYDRHACKIIHSCPMLPSVLQYLIVLATIAAWRHSLGGTACCSRVQQ